MINGPGGAYFEIWDRSGSLLQSQMYMDAITGISGLGDPIVLYDQFADRWLLSEFASAGNKLIVMISQTNDPLANPLVKINGHHQIRLHGFECRPCLTAIDVGDVDNGNGKSMPHVRQSGHAGMGK